ncbi:MAG TPA: nitrogen fixation protein NifH [Thermoproteota archaeon]|nr:nitrogen fixation protein NifH [Thermoproteota archaeon]
MEKWRSFLKSDPTDWLLESDNPSVKHFTLVDILGRTHDDSEVIETKDQIMKIGPVPKILAKEKGGGYWGRPEEFYFRSKYKGGVWQLIILAELGANGNNTKVKKACEFILENSQDRQSGGFAYLGSKEKGGQHGGVIPCLTGNMVWSLIRLGHLEDPRVQHGIDWITRYQRFDDGAERALEGWPYRKNDNCLGKHSCHMGVVKALKALAEIPEGRRNKEVRAALAKGAEYMLIHHIHKRSHNLSKVSKPGWLKFGFPRMYNTDVLEILGVMTGLGYKDRRMQEAVDLVVSKQDEQSRWKLEDTFNGRFQVNIERKDKPSKWITLNALRVLKRYYS